MTISSFERARSSATFFMPVGLALIASTMVCAARPILTQDEATATVLEHGFRLAAKAEPANSPRNPAAWEAAAALPSWDIWAVKDGIAYRVTVDGSTGDLVSAAPAVEDD